MKVVFIIAAVLACMAVSLAQSHNSTFGKRMTGDQLIFRDVVYAKSSFLRKQTRNYEFNQTNIPYPKIITQVLVIDQYKNGNGGYCTLSSGGPGMSTMKLYFSSQRNHGFNFIIEIFGLSYGTPKYSIH